jgi:putative sporulation protein YtaF
VTEEAMGMKSEFLLPMKGDAIASRKDEQTVSEIKSSNSGNFRSALIATVVITAGALIAAATLGSIGFFFEHATRSASGAHFGGSVQYLLYALLIALANNVDNLGVRIAYSLQGTRVNTLINLWISLITFMISFAAAFSGLAVKASFGAKVGSEVAAGLLVALGSWMILQESKQSWLNAKPPEKKNAASMWAILSNPQQADVDGSKHIDFKEGTVLGIALSINNIGGSLSAGIILINPLLIASLSALISFTALWAGNYLTALLVKRRIPVRAAVGGGILLIAIGAAQLFP